jgi:hypothetical protein
MEWPIYFLLRETCDGVWCETRQIGPKGLLSSIASRIKQPPPPQTHSIKNDNAISFEMCFASDHSRPFRWSAIVVVRRRMAFHDLSESLPYTNKPKTPCFAS